MKTTVSCWNILIVLPNLLAEDLNVQEKTDLTNYFKIFHKNYGSLM